MNTMMPPASRYASQPNPSGVSSAKKPYSPENSPFLSMGDSMLYSVDGSRGGYRSTSPMFTSRLPKITIRSATFHPISISASTVRLMKDGERILQR